MTSLTGQFPKPRIGIVVIDDSLYTHRWVRRILDENQAEVRFITCISPFEALNFNPGGAKGVIGATIARLRYYGLGASAKFAVKAFIANVRDRLFDIGFSSEPQSVASLAESRGIRTLNAPSGNINDKDFCNQVRKLTPDLLICAFSQKAEESFLSSARLGCLNVHFSMLPEHRGREPLFWSMLAGHGAGVSTHWMTSRFDSGEVVYQRAMEIGAVKTLHEAILTAAELAGNVVLKAIPKAIAWKHGEASKGKLLGAHGWPTLEDTKTFCRQGYRFV